MSDQSKGNAQGRDIDLSGKVALVTGGSSGIGAAIAVELGRRGANVGVNYHSEADAAQKIVQQIEGFGSKAIAIQANVGKVDEINSMVQQVIDKFGRIDIMVNNAGIESSQSFLDKTEEDWDRTLAVDLKGPFFCTQAAVRDMAKRKERGTVINISSVHEDLPFPGYSSYCAAKGGLRMLCRDLALELAPYNVNIVNVGPGAIATPINEETLENPEKKMALEREIPLGRIGTPQEVGVLVAYLASDAASYITGTTIFIDGGLKLQTGSL